MSYHSPTKGKDETLDTFYHGRILVLQKKKGYRFAVDAPLLADFVQTTASDECLELGTGSGIIALLLSIKSFKHITAVEIQESLADLARRNVQLNNLKERIAVVEEDIRLLSPLKKYDVIFSNPPYIRAREGRLSDSREKSIAKHEVKCGIFDIMQKTSELLKKKGRAYFIYAVKRKKDLINAAEEHGLKAKAMRFVYPRKEEEPNLFLVECDFTSTEIDVLPSLFLRDEKGRYTKEALEIFSGRIHASNS